VELYRDEADRAFRSIPHSDLVELAWMCAKAYGDGRRLYACGNGGSVGILDNLCADLNAMPRASDDKSAVNLGSWSAFRAINLYTSASEFTAAANDRGFDGAYAEILSAIGAADDLLLAVSGSGNSKNILAAVAAARSMGMRVCGITRNAAGKLYAERQHGEMVLLVDLRSEFPGQTGGNNANMHMEDIVCKIGHMVSGILRTCAQGGHRE